MHTLVKQRIVWTWIALLGVLFGALAPTISHALAAAGADEEVQVCTMDGMRTIVVDPGPGAPSAAAAKFDPHMFDHFLEHCPYCALHASLPAAPPPGGFVFALPAPAPAYPPLFYRAAAPLFSWLSAHPRGPPASN